MIKTALKNDPVLIFAAPAVLLVGVVVKLVVGMEPIDQDAWSVLDVARSWPVWINALLTALMALVTAFLINQMVQNLGLLGRITNLTMLLFALFYFAIPDGVNFWVAWPIVVLQLFLLRMLEVTYDQPERSSRFAFNMGIIVGVTSLCVEGGFILFFSIVHALVLSGAASFRRILTGVLGVLTPIYLFNALAYLFNWEFVWPRLQPTLKIFSNEMEKLDVLGLAFIVFMTIVTIFSVLSVSSSTTLRERRRWIVLIGYLIISGLLVINQGFTEPVFIAIVPATVVLARTLIMVKNRKIANAILLVFLAFVLMINS